MKRAPHTMKYNKLFMSWYSDAVQTRKARKCFNENASACHKKMHVAIFFPSSITKITWNIQQKRKKNLIEKFRDCFDYVVSIFFLQNIYYYYIFLFWCPCVSVSLYVTVTYSNKTKSFGLAFQSKKLII